MATKLKHGLLPILEKQKLEDLHYLRMSFPNEPKEYLERKYEVCECDLEKTMEKVAQKKRGSWFENFLMSLAAFLCCGSEGTSENDDEYNTSEVLRKRSEEFFNESLSYSDKANNAKDADETALADKNFLLAKFQLQMSEQAKARAVLVCLNENKIRTGYRYDLDLHHLSVKQAIQVLDFYIDTAIFDLKRTKKNDKDFTIVTGRGKHSPNGKPLIKPAVLNRLRQRKLRYNFKFS